MAVKLKWPWLGIAIPLFLISFIGYCAHYFILSNFLPTKKQLWFEFSLGMIWISYYLAIYTNPGKPTPGFRPSKFEWENFCNKCNNYKPERAHHCKACNQCVLSMDHHCPWTMNCVGHKNFAHFIRFLFWVIETTGFLLTYLVKRILFLWNRRHMPNYFVHRSELIFLTILTPMDAFVLLTISLLLLRCAKNQILKGMTQIESWEMDRIENMFHSGQLIPQMLENLKEIRPGSLSNQDNDIRKLLSQNRLSLDEIVNFPYDLNPWANAVNSLGDIYSWLLPWGTAKGNGMIFEKNELSVYEPEIPIEDKLLSLPWPPDGGRHKVPGGGANDVNSVESSTRDGERVVRKRWVDPRTTMPRKKWYNDWGENLADFGVDLDEE